MAQDTLVGFFVLNVESFLKKKYLGVETFSKIKEKVKSKRRSVEIFLLLLQMVFSCICGSKTRTRAKPRKEKK